MGNESNMNDSHQKSTRHFRGVALAAAVLLVPSIVFGQQASTRQTLVTKSLEQPSATSQTKEASLIDEVLEPELLFLLDPAQSKVVKTKIPVDRIAVTDPSFVEISEYGPTEFEVIGLKPGETTMTIWFRPDHDPIKHPNGSFNSVSTGGRSRPAENGQLTLRYLVKVASPQAVEQRVESELSQLESRVNELFPNSQVQLFPVADKLIVRGQARDAKEAAEILSLLGRQGGGQAPSQNGQNMGGVLVQVANLPGAGELRFASVINLLQVPGEQQVILKVRIAELTRSASRNAGMDFKILKDFALTSSIGGAGNISAILDGGDIELFLKAFSTNGYGKILAEPTLVTLSGQTATFIAGGEFAIPTAVGAQGVGAIATTFKGFGTQLSFTPTVIDKDRIRLQVAPTFSTLNAGNSVNGIPGLSTRGVTTTVDLREGQWLAVAGLIQDEQGGSRKRIPFLGDIPVVGAAFSAQTSNRNETELVVLVSPELVHPLEPDQVPALLPGMSVTDPTDKAFYLLQHTEGHSAFPHRSTVWPAYKQHVQADKWIQKHLRQKASAGYCEPQQQYYFAGPHGLSE